jgi:hypothetical protein
MAALIKMVKTVMLASPYGLFFFSPHAASRDEVWMLLHQASIAATTLPCLASSIHCWTQFFLQFIV